MDAVMVVVAAGRALRGSLFGEVSVLSDQGLPSIVTRNMLMGSKSESVVLPLVARIVQTQNAALNASNSEEKDLDVEMSSGFGNVNILIFALYASRGEAKVSMGASKFLNSGASGFGVIGRLEDELKSSSKLISLDMENDIHEKTTVAGFVKLEDREKQLIEKERSLLLEAIDVMQKATSLSDSEEQLRHERHPDGQYICYLPAPILKEMNIVNTPGTNVILQRQQRLTEEFVPRADLLLFVFSADKPLTESELEEAILFIKENTRKLLNTDDVILYPISARSALEAKLSASSDTGKEYSELSVSESHLKITRFYELKQFLYSFLDASTTTGMERIRLTLETPIAIAERLLSACETLVNQDCQYAKQDLTSAT
ncbi:TRANSMEMBRANE GTPASE FZO [Salix purpurea]|uniref:TRANSMEMBRANE GTPASE FZO n=1 Tax=Salix purpurea TaxID=77065 RepID=A0A9Q0SPZ8_SALPP|nr:TRANSMEMBRANE GTPASE FZO [Salix purpurea]